MNDSKKILKNKKVKKSFKKGKKSFKKFLKKVKKKCKKMKKCKKKNKIKIFSIKQYGKHTFIDEQNL